MAAKPKWKKTVKDWIAWCLGHLSVIHNPLKRPIFVFSTRRGGSTLMMRMIYSQPGVDYISQPLDLWQHHPFAAKLPNPYLKRFVSLRQDEELLLVDYFQKLLSGRSRIRNQWNLLDTHFSFRVDRLVVKELNAKSLMDWFTEHFDMEVIYLLRHPIPTALSIIKRGWGNTAEAYLRDDWFVDSFLGHTRKAFCEDVLAHGSRLERHVLEWCLENLYPLRFFEERNWLTVTYEELVLRSHQVSVLICSRLDLPNHQRMYKSVLKPTNNVMLDSKAQIMRDGPASRVLHWTRLVSQQDLAAVEKILLALDTSAYTAYSPTPNRTLCHFGPLEDEIDADP